MAKTYLADTAYDLIRNKILKAEYLPGSTISEEKLVADLGFSRTPIRSALVRLEQEHLIKTISKKGIYIEDISYEHIHDIYECRLLMEPYAIRNYGNRFSKKKLQEFCHEFMTQKQDSWEWFLQDNLFHAEIIHLCGNELLNDYYESLQSLNLRISAYSSAITDRINLSNDEHIAVINALLKDKYEQAAELLTLHLTKAKDAAYTILEQTNKEPESN
ncbi:MAG: GntR family transcriptional regulator [Firmicutes bacterium]|nr:GntR family transcriptional regulator [Bacillota bacterium]